MKKIVSIFILLIIAFSCKAQHTNLTNAELFDGITFNNISLGAIMETKGDLAQMRNLFGNSIQMEQNETAPNLAKDLFNDKIYFGFEDDTDTGNDYYLAFINVKDPTVVVKVKKLSISIGDDKEKFGKMLMNPTSHSYNFLDAETGSADLFFEIDQTSNKVTAIKFILY